MGLGRLAKCEYWGEPDAYWDGISDLVGDWHKVWYPRILKGGCLVVGQQGAGMFSSVPKAKSNAKGGAAQSALQAFLHALGILTRRLAGPPSRPKKSRAKKSAAAQPIPTIDLIDIRHVSSWTLCASGEASVAVVMPCIDLKVGMETARLLASRAGMEASIVVANDTLRQGFVKTLNDSAAHISARYIVYLAQDAYPGRNWLRDAHEALERTGKGLLGFNEGTYKGRIATFGMVRTDWVRRLYGGPIFHPGYNCHGADNELTVIARASDAYVYEPNCTLVEYDPDKDSKPGHKLDAKLFRERFVTGFDGLVPMERLRQLAVEYKVNPSLLSGS